jgi:hypothetical protein
MRDLSMATDDHRLLDMLPKMGVLVGSETYP